MKRLVWLLLAIFGTALAQVTPVDVPVLAKHATCHCCGCEKPGACGMPDCAPPPASAPKPVLNLASPVTATRVAARSAVAVIRRPRVKFYACFLPRDPVAPAPARCLSAEFAASVPLFRAHCSLLI